MGAGKHALRETVERELEADPRFDASAVGVTAKHGAVTLSGFVDTYSAKLAAERAAKRVRGVRAVADDLQVRLRLSRPDDEIARDAARALELRSTVPVGVQASVRNGHITLTGHVSWHFQREAAERRYAGPAPGSGGTTTGGSGAVGFAAGAFQERSAFAAIANSFA